ncbi:MAG: hypothetical protein ACRD2L_19390 [Terriglobia bacterium]
MDRQRFDEWLQEPKMVGAAEYHAIHEVLEANMSESDEMLMTILEEFEDWARALSRKLRKMRMKEILEKGIGDPNPHGE